MLCQAGTCHHCPLSLMSLFSQAERGEGIICIMYSVCLLGLSQRRQVGCSLSSLSLSVTIATHPTPLELCHSVEEFLYLTHLLQLFALAATSIILQMRYRMAEGQAYQRPVMLRVDFRNLPNHLQLFYPVSHSLLESFPHVFNFALSFFCHSFSLCCHFFSMVTAQSPHILHLELLYIQRHWHISEHFLPL